MDSLSLVGLFIGIFGLTVYAGMLLQRALRLYRQRADLRRALWPLIVNLAEPFISLLYLIPCLLWWDYGYLVGLVGRNFAASSIVFAYHWPMQILLVLAPLSQILAQTKLVARTAGLCFATGFARMSMLWLSFNYLAGGAMVVLALLVSAASFWLLGRYLVWLGLPIPQRPIAVTIDEQGLILIQPIAPAAPLPEPNPQQNADL
ncbi:hypothetical protein [Herpetosiphon giganteus]|uniref:hypothetical protein n=1 Tax=Herpetosiphon giganteus TaxID=2029754 RepID=UPI00195696EF|nr:hypothetical protein [Herpetosiphon giganteus]MBM7842839.1 hypothetical protein [Herpetosiphon giganteus]